MVPREHRKESRIFDSSDLNQSSSRITHVGANDLLIMKKEQDARATTEQGIGLRIIIQLVVDFDTHRLQDTGVVLVRISLFGVESQLKGFWLRKNYP